MQESITSQKIVATLHVYQKPGVSGWPCFLACTLRKASSEEKAKIDRPWAKAMALCVSPSAYFFSITSTFPNAVYEKGRVFPVQSLLVHPLCCFFLLIPQCSFTVIPAICKQASTLQREILKVSTVTQPIWLHTLGQILPQNCHI